MSRVHIRAELVICLVVAVVGGLLLWYSMDMRLGRVPDPLGARGFPRIVGTSFIAGAVIVAIGALRRRSATGPYIPSDGAADEEGHPASALRVLGLWLVAVGWLVLVPRVGYLIVTPPALIAFLLAMRVRLRSAVPLAVTVPIALWLVFSKIFGVPLPQGFLSGVLT